MHLTLKPKREEKKKPFRFGSSDLKFLLSCRSKSTTKLKNLIFSTPQINLNKNKQSRIGKTHTWKCSATNSSLITAYISNSKEPKSQRSKSKAISLAAWSRTGLSVSHPLSLYFQKPWILLEFPRNFLTLFFFSFYLFFWL